MEKVDKFIQNQNFCMKEKLSTMCNRVCSFPGKDFQKFNTN